MKINADTMQRAVRHASSGNWTAAFTEVLDEAARQAWHRYGDHDARLALLESRKQGDSFYVPTELCDDLDTALKIFGVDLPAGTRSPHVVFQDELLPRIRQLLRKYEELSSAYVALGGHFQP